MIDYGHLCLLIFAQGTWKESYKNKLLDQIKKNFLSNMNIDDIDVWNEINKSPLLILKISKQMINLANFVMRFLKFMREKRGE